MKGYEVDEKVNYDDLKGDSLGEVKGYGPCSKCGNRNITFELEIILRNCLGGWKSRTVYNVNDARYEASNIVKEECYWEDGFDNVFSAKKRRRLAKRINQAIDEHINYNKNINRTVDGDESPSNSDDETCIPS